MTVGTAVTSFWYWWIGELKALVPDGLQRKFAARPPRYSILCQDGGFTIIDARQSARHHGPPEGDRYEDPLEAAQALKLKLKNRAGRRSIGVSVPIDKCLVRQLTVPAASLPRLNDILALDIVRLVPGGAQSVLSGSEIGPQRDAGTREIRHYIVKCDLVQPMLVQAEQHGLPVDHYSIQNEHGEIVPVNLVTSDSEAATAHDPASKQVLKAAAVVAVFIMAGALYFVFDKQQHAIAQLEHQVGEAKKQALWVRREVERVASSSSEIASVHNKKLSTYRVMEIWEEATRILPDSAWVNGMTMKDNTLLLSGFAKAAAELIGPLQASALFTETSFASPVVMGPQRKKERFQIRLSIGKRTVEGKP